MGAAACVRKFCFDFGNFTFGEMIDDEMNIGSRNYIGDKKADHPSEIADIVATHSDTQSKASSRPR